MLVLARKPGQKITIGEGITVMVTEVKPNGTVKLGIQAPREVPVHREEVQRRIEEARTC